MFNLWNNDGKLSEGSIKQANEHLLLVNQRVVELEQRIHEQKELLDRREQEHIDRLRALACQKDAEIKSVAQELTVTRQRSARLEGMVKERDVQIAFLLHRCSYLDEAASYAPLLDQLSQCLKNAFAAPSPKVQTVNPTTILEHKKNCCVLNGNAENGENHSPEKEPPINTRTPANVAPIRTKPIL